MKLLFCALRLGFLLSITSVFADELIPLKARAFDGDRAYAYLKTISEIGPRYSGSPGMEKQRQLLNDHFVCNGATVKLQSFDAPHPLTGTAVRMENMLVAWPVKSDRKILICCHYDTRPFPDRDPVAERQKGEFIGANDGASGVAFLMELADQFGTNSPHIGVEFVLFDGEELIIDNKGGYLLGSKHFSKVYSETKDAPQYAAAIVVDMIGDKDLKICREVGSVKYAPNLVEGIWKSASSLQSKVFSEELKHELADDHLPLNKTAQIPSVLIIDFVYPAWHTTDDTPAQCSGESLSEVGKVILHWLQTQEQSDESK